MAIIVLVKKSLAFITSGAAYLTATISAFAQTKIPLAAPTGSVGNIDIAQIPQFLISLLFVIGVIVAVVFLIYGGIKWILSGGDKTAVESARNHIIAAIVGLVIVVAAFLILNVVFTIITGSKFDLNNLCIPTLANPTCK